MNLGKRIKKAREAMGISELELASKAKVKEQTIRRYESNQGKPKYLTLLGLGLLLETDLTDSTV